MSNFPTTRDEFIITIVQYGLEVMAKTSKPAVEYRIRIEAQAFDGDGPDNRLVILPGRSRLESIGGEIVVDAGFSPESTRDALALMLEWKAEKMWTLMPPHPFYEVNVWSIEPDINTQHHISFWCDKEM